MARAVVLFLLGGIFGLALGDPDFLFVNEGSSAYLVNQPIGFAGSNPTLVLVRGKTYTFDSPSSKYGACSYPGWGCGVAAVAPPFLNWQR